jgi:hypothetical protein
VRFLLVLFLAPVIAAAQTTEPDEPIQVSRPDITTSPRVLPVRRPQLETGETYERRSRRDPARWEFDETVLRYGLAPRFEVRLELPHYRRTDLASEPDGFDDLTASAIAYLGRFHGFDLGLLPSLTIPVGPPEIRSERAIPALSLLVSRDVGHDVSLASTLGVAFTQEEGRRFERATATLELSAPLASRLDGFVEYAGFYDRVGAPTSYGHVGVVLRLSRASALDAHVGVGLNRATESAFFGAGYSVRF